MTDPKGLLGEYIHSQAVATFLAAHGGPHTVDDFDDEDPSVRRYATSPNSGVALSIDDKGFINVVFLHVNRHAENPEFRGTLPFGLSNKMTRRDARRLLGAPTFERTPQVHPVLGSYGHAERYDLADCSVHLEYAEPSGKLSLVTIMAASAVPDTTVDS